MTQGQYVVTYKRHVDPEERYGSNFEEPTEDVVYGPTSKEACEAWIRNLHWGRDNGGYVTHFVRKVTGVRYSFE